MADGIVIRHSDSFILKDIEQVFDLVPLINGGDGFNEHPTQALIDLYTIRQELGTIGGLTITIVGDLLHSRTVHSLIKGLVLRDNIRLNYVAPYNLQLSNDLWDYVSSRGITQQRYFELTDSLLRVSDVIYVTRLQKERHSNDNFHNDQPYFRITPQHLAKAKDSLRILHAFPRGDEIDPAIDCDRRAAYFRQMANGPYIRMALLLMLFKIPIPVNNM
jgi:carbamoyl-phosphate synthase/aspartate carbamoyltransferase